MTKARYVCSYCGASFADNADHVYHVHWTHINPDAQPTIKAENQIELFTQSEIKAAKRSGKKTLTNNRYGKVVQ